MKPKLFTFLAIGALLAITLAILTLTHNKSLRAILRKSSIVWTTQGFEIANDVDIMSQGIYIPSVQPKSANPNITANTASPHATTVVRNYSRLTPYMMALHIAEQLTMSTSHFVEFLNLVHQWNFTGVEPVVYGSRMFALRSMHPDNINGSVHYHQMLNTSLMRDKLSKCLERNDVNQGSNSSQLFIPLSVFLRQSMRGIVLVYFSKHMNVIGKKLHAAADAELGKSKSMSGRPIIECTDILRRSGVSGRVEELLNHELIIEGANTVTNFTVIQAFCVMPKVKISLVKIREDILTSIHRNKSNMIDVSIIFVSWQGKYTRPFTDMDTLYRCRLPSSLIEPSQQVIATSDQFLKSLGLEKQPYLAIHIRFEKLYETAFWHHKDHPRHFLRCCMLKLNVVLKQVKERNNLTSEGSTLLLHDYGHYGTDVCKQEGWRSRSVCVNESQYLLSFLNETGKAAEFDPVKFGAPKNTGFVSLVERQALVGSQTLVVVGGGSFQISIVSRFTDRHKREQETQTAQNSHEALAYRLFTGHDNLHGLELDEVKECTHSS